MATAGLKALGAEIDLEHLKELFDNLSLAKFISEESDDGGVWVLFMIPRPTKSSKEHLSLTWNARSSSLRLKSYWRTSVLKRMSVSILFRPPLLLRSCL